MSPKPRDALALIRTRSTVWLQTALRALWFIVVPALLAMIAARDFVPRSVDSPDIARIVGDYPFPVALGLFLLFASLVRYWRSWLPGGRYLALLPVERAAAVPRHALPAYERAAELTSWLASANTRAAAVEVLPEEQRARAEAALEELRAALAGNEPARLNAARESIETLFAIPWRARTRRRALRFAAVLGSALLLALLVRTSLVQSYRVNGMSMLPSLEPRDNLLGNRMAYGLRLPGSTLAIGRRLPRRGELVLFKRQVDGVEQELVKRVIGLPGDVITMRGTHVVINGWRVPSCDAGIYVYHDGAKQIFARLLVEFLEDEVYLTVHGLRPPRVQAYEVPAGELFTVGDNRGHSFDSRTWGGGQPGGVSVGSVLARVDRVVFSQDPTGQFDFTRTFRRAGINLDLDALDTRELQAGIERCLAEPPPATRPPASGEPSARAQAP